METTKLDTVDKVSDAISALVSITSAELRAYKPAQRRERAARLADLYEIRAQLFDETDLFSVPAGQVRTFAVAIARAAQADRDSMRFWRNEAGAR